MTIKFSNDATTATFAGVISGGVIGWTVDIEHDNDGYPGDQVAILSATEQGFVVCETDEVGAPLPHSTWEVPYEGLRAITVR
jgi:hypothetical protein